MMRIHKLMEEGNTSMKKIREEHDGCLDAMFSAYLAEEKAETDCEDNIYSVAMAFAAIKSAEEKRTVYLSELI